MRIELIRHGKTAFQKEKRYQGISDIPLSDVGRRELVESKKCPEKVYVTPLIRTMETASLIFPGASQVVCEGLREMDFGVFEGRNYIEMENDAEYRKWVDGMCMGQCPGGESGTGYYKRASEAFRDLVKEAADRGEEELYVVAHGGTQMAVLGSFAKEIREYHLWQAESGMGYVLETQGEFEGRWIDVIGSCDYTSKEGSR